MSIRRTILLTLIAASLSAAGCSDRGAIFDYDNDGYPDDVDCDPTDPEIHPGAEEVCDGEDNDCDGEIDDVDAENLPSWYPDRDGDGFGVDDDAVIQCEQPDGHVAQGGDCDDTESTTHPGAEELCDGVDNDCDEIVPDDEQDGDGDGIWPCEGDCADDAAGIYPGATEVCNNLDDDCDGEVPRDEIDGDFDGFRPCEGDCNDEDATVYPGAEEIPGDGTDQDCDGSAGVDADGDGYYDEQGGGDDCDDGDATIHPGAEEVCDGQDNDCDPATDEGLDADLDGFTICDGDCDDTEAAIYPDAVELCDGWDNDCDGAADEDCVTCTSLVPTDHTLIQDAISAAAVGDSICVLPGTYLETLDFQGKDIHVQGVDGPEVTTVHAMGGGSVVSFVTGESHDAVLEGFTLTGGFNTYGGGVFVNFASPTLIDLHVTGNDVSVSGGGIYVSGGDPTLADLLIQGNMAATDGGGIDLFVADVVLDNVAIVSNEAEYGGGIHMHGSSPSLSHVWIADNVAADSGGGMDVVASSPTLEDFAITGNEAMVGIGGAFQSSTSDPVLNQGVVVGNAAVSVGGIAFNDGYTLSLTHVILAYNQGTIDGGGLWGLYADTTLDHCNFYGNLPENFSWFQGDPIGVNGNISQPPLFLDVMPIDSWDWDLHLEPASPCVDAGKTAILDPDGGFSDMGMYGGPASGVWDLDGDGAPSWWQPGPYDFIHYPGDGWDCDDHDPLLGPGNGC